MAFITTGDRAMPSIALCAARFAAKHGLGRFGDNLFANTVVDPAKQDGKSITLYMDADDDGKTLGTVRTLASGPTWYLDKLMLTCTGGDTATAIRLVRSHVNFLCSIRGENLLDEETQTWYRILHAALIGRVLRTGRTPGNMDVYEAALRVMWRPMSAKDPGYAEVTGIKPPDLP